MVVVVDVVAVVVDVVAVVFDVVAVVAALSLRGCQHHLRAAYSRHGRIVVAPSRHHCTVVAPSSCHRSLSRIAFARGPPPLPSGTTPLWTHKPPHHHALLLKSMLPPPPPPCSTQARGRYLQPITVHKSAATVTPYSAQEPPQCHPHMACIPHRYDTDSDGNWVDDDDIAEGDGGGDVEGDSGCHVESNDNGDMEDDGGCGGRRRTWRTMADMEDDGRHGGRRQMWRTIAVVEGDSGRGGQ
ncbi:hypothetical protein EDB86DRAFT_2834184 [Lactarius hatsudake]|nr:hypothetical protein EDB86DRAFT_2834184 [Lactarius hatsudake]